MKLITNSVRTILLASAFIMSGCVSMDQHRDAHPDPDTRLNQMLAMYEKTDDFGNSCNELWNAYSATTDCERIQREVERLGIEFPNHPRIMMANATMQYQAGRPDKAQFTLDQLLADRGPHPEAAILRTKIALEEGNTARARAVLQKQIIISPSNFELREALASTYYIEGKYDEAAKALSAAGRLGAPGWRLSYHQGLIREARKDWKGACSLYLMSIEQRPDFQAPSARLIGLTEHESCRVLADGRGYKVGR
ncbi:tetratricopeptide repeat protein [Zhongshania sp.]|uniref:tetratricopeptide repeat protein n=1 Tax=Zhongshania sp. TaxID=1971902 RepID=UPI003567918B